MSIIKSKPYDPSLELDNKEHELFVNTYLDLDRDKPLMQSKEKRKKSYKKAYPTYKGKDSDTMAKRVLRNEKVIQRIDFLTKDEEAGIENTIKWTKDKAENTLIDLILNSDKDADKLNALKELNKIRKIGVEEKGNDDITVRFIKEFGELEED